MNAVSFTDAVRNIQDMFPSFDPELIGALLQQNGNHIERTIEQVLQMADPSAAEGGSSGNASKATAPAAAAPGPDPSPLNPSRQQQRQRQPPASVFQSAGRGDDASASAPASAGRSGGRGSIIVLPDAFLRPPGWRDGFSGDSLTMGDEQLAIMLQDEMFRKELQGAGLGGLIGGGSGGGGAAPTQQGSGIPDMGILKGLSSLSEMSRRNLNNLAQKFRSRNTAATTTSSAMDRGNESISLLHAQDLQDSDEEEVIDFQASNKKNK